MSGVAYCPRRPIELLKLHPISTTICYGILVFYPVQATNLFFLAMCLLHRAFSKKHLFYFNTCPVNQWLAGQHKKIPRKPTGETKNRPKPTKTFKYSCTGSEQKLIASSITCVCRQPLGSPAQNVVACMLQVGINADKGIIQPCC